MSDAGLDIGEYFHHELVFHVNRKRMVVHNPNPTMPLIQFLRTELGLTGTKLGCGEGGCGACTVMISTYDPEQQKILHRSVNACLFPLCAVDRCHVTTIEGIGSTLTGLHPIQKRIAESHGSQCGFCTPGIVMALYAYLHNHPNASELDIEENLDGNLCRCTGYRPILDAARSFAGCGLPNCCQTKTSADQHTGTNGCANGGPPLSLEDRPASEPVFPHYLKEMHPRALHFTGSNCLWFKPLTLSGLLQLRRKYPDARIVVGSTEIGVEMRLKGFHPHTLIDPTGVPELTRIAITADGIEVGAAVTLARFKEALEGVLHATPPEQSFRLEGVRALLYQLKWFAGNQIRNAACVAGNIATASPISDLNPVFIALGATLSIASADQLSPRKVDMGDLSRPFFVKYRTVAMSKEEVILSVFIPFTREHEYVKAFKQARRRDDDIAIVTACFRVRFAPPTAVAAARHAVDCRLVFGGMAPLTVVAVKASQFISSGVAWSEDMLGQVLTLLADDLPLAPDAPGGMIAYRSSLTTSFFYKFFLEVSSRIGVLSVPATEHSAFRDFRRTVSRGTQGFGGDAASLATAPLPGDATAGRPAPIGEPRPHLSAYKQVTGEAVYTDDMPSPAGGLYAAFVLSRRPHAVVRSVDTHSALAANGVVAYIDWRDVPGSNKIGPVVLDEEIFAENEVTCVGQPIGLIVAESHTAAVNAARRVVVDYIDMPAILTIEDAIAHQSFYKDEHKIVRGEIDVDTALQSAEFTVAGEVRIGGQEHFYLEPNVSLAIPGEGREMTVWASTQNPMKTQSFVASALGCHDNEVVCKVKRMGGGFGGKETRSVFVSCAAAVAAWKTRRPVRLVLDRDVDMLTTGGRHPFYARYRVGFDRTGRMTALDVQLYSNGGNSLDLSQAVMDRALFHIDNVYNIPVLRVVGRVCRTNLPSNTAFRGFGGPQAMLVAETVVAHVAATLGMPRDVVMETNFYREGDTTHFGQVLEGCHVARCVGEVRHLADYDARRHEVAAFNATNRWRKRGLAVVATKFGMSFTAKFMNQAGALVHVYTDGSVLVTHGGCEMGQGLHTKMAMVAAAALGVPLELVHVAETATDKVPNSSPTAASVQSDMNGMAVLQACELINKRLDSVRHRLGSGATWQQVVKAAYFDRISLSATGFYATPDIGYEFANDGRGVGKPFAYFCYGAACSMVEIDCLTGDHVILRTDLVMDVGRSLNPAIDIGQVEGAFVQGVGWCTLEEVVFNANGELFTRGPSTYKLPGFGDVPLEFNVRLLSDAGNPRAIHSSKGVGEPPFFLAASVFFAIRDAIASARQDAGKGTGFFPLESPATCERIRMACEDRFTAQFVKK